MKDFTVLLYDWVSTRNELDEATNESEKSRIEQTLRDIKDALAQHITLYPLTDQQAKILDETQNYYDEDDKEKRDSSD